MITFERANPDETVVLAGVTWNAVVALLEMIEPLKNEVAGLRHNQQTKSIDFFLARITGSAVLGSEVNRWKYAWSEIRMDDDDSVVKTSGRSGTTTVDYALNLCEDANDGADIEAPGIDVGGASYPAGFDMVPIQGSPVVLMLAIRTLDGDVIKYVFCLGNDHDGDC